MESGRRSIRDLATSAWLAWAFALLFGVLLVPADASAKSCFVGCSSTEYCALDLTCQPRGSANQGCSGLGQGTCRSGLVCDFAAGKCRHDPPTSGETCNAAVACASAYYCNAAVGGSCVARRAAGQSCSGLGQGTCQSGLACDISGVCRHSPPTQGEPCGVGVPCAAGLACSSLVAGTCQAPKQAGQACVGIGQGNCVSGLVCDVSGVCRHDPPDSGEPCGTGVSCKSGLACSALVAGVCIAPRQAGQSCVGVGQGNCDSSLVCDFSGVCRHQPPELGEPCGLGVDCASGLLCNAEVGGTCTAPRAAGESCGGLGQGNCQSGLVCDVLGVCRHDPPALGEPCGVGVSCSGNLVCTAVVGGVCSERRLAGQSCIGVGQGNCDDDLLCDVSGVCRHDPPVVGEPCGAGVSCSGDLVCTAVVGGVCSERRLAGQSCVGVGQGNCDSSLVCDFSGVCRHQPPELGEPCGLGVDCASGLLCNAEVGGTCTTPRAAGESCGGVGQGNCQSELVCDALGVCRHDPPALGEPCGVGVSCSGNLVCTAVVGGVCSERRLAGQSCVGVGQGNCDSSLVCDFSGVCRHQPPELGEPCGLGVDCASGLLCNAEVGGTCTTPRAAGESCGGVGQGNCQSELVCDVLGVCRHDPPEDGEPCGLGVDCASGLLCNAEVGGTCTAPRAAGESCGGLGQGNCQSELVCDVLGVCRHDPPEDGEPCGVGVACTSGLVCNALVAGTCTAPGAAGASCIGLGQGNCNSGLVCDVSGHCRHDPPEDGEPCGTGVSCAGDLVCTALVGGTCSPRRTVGQSCLGVGQGTCDSSLVCDVSGVCRHDPPEHGEPCGTGVSCSGDLVCTALVGGTCLPRRTVGQSCLGVGQGTCNTDLVCDAFSGSCRHDPPLLGEACSVFAACVDDLVCVQSRCREPGASGAPCTLLDPDSCQAGLVCDLGTSTCRHNPPLADEACGGLIQCAGALTCLAQRCVEQGDAGDPCDPTVGSSCQLGLVCDPGRFVCRHDPSRVGEACIGLGRGSCDTGLVCDVSGECRHSPPQRGEPCGQFVNCATGLACNALVGGRCGTPRKVGESCIGIGRANCEDGAICRLFVESGALGLKCFPEGNGPIPAGLCRRFYSSGLSATSDSLGTALTFGAASGGGAGVAATAETGVAYGADGEYGCYFVNCVGAVTDATVGAGVCGGLYNSYGDVAGNSSVIVESVTPLEEGPTFSTAQVFTPLGSPPAQLIGTSDCLSLGVGVLPADVGTYECHTQVTTVDLDRSSEGFYDSVLTALNLDPSAPGGDSDADGVADVAELGGDPNAPLDSDSDGVIDALEAGDAATTARIASGVPLPGGGSVTITTQAGELLTGVGTAPADGSPPPGIDFPFGAISYMTTAPVGGTVVVQLAFSRDLPPDPMPYKLDHSGGYALLSPSLWTRLDARTLAFTLTDGEGASDLDGLADGIIDDPLAIGTQSVEPNVVPVVDAGPDEVLAAGDAFAGSGSFFDPDDGDTWTAVVDYGDGSGPQPLALGADQSFALSHVFGAPGTYVVTVFVSDSHDGTGVDLRTVKVEAVGMAEQTIFDLAARAKSGKVDLTWSPVPGADGYNVYRGPAQDGPYESIADAHASDYAVYADSGLVDGRQYCYVVISLVGGVESLPSNVACATPTATRTRGR